MTSAISAASSSANSGTRAIMLQVTTKSRRCTCSEKPVAMMPTGSAIRMTPVKMPTVRDQLAEPGHRHDVAIADGADA